MTWREERSGLNREHQVALASFFRTSARKSFAFGGSIALFSRRGPDITEGPFSAMDDQDDAGNGFISILLDAGVRVSFPRKACPELAEGRESTSRALESALSTDWIPALRQAQGKLFAGMTGVSRRIPSQTTPAQRRGLHES
jgi:hypothetical protein